MLILARYPQQAILIGEVQITILDVVSRKHGRPRVTLGIDAPPEIRVLRAELPRYQPYERNNPPSSHLEPDPKDYERTASTEPREEAEPDGFSLHRL